MTYANKINLRNPNFLVDAIISGYGDNKTVQPVFLFGGAFDSSSLDANVWIASTANSATATSGGGEARIRTNTSANGVGNIQSSYVARLIPGTVNYCVMSVRLGDIGVTNNKRQWGCFDGNNGYFFQLSGTTFTVVSRKAASDTTVTSFNGSTPVIDTNYHLYELYYTHEGAWLLQDGILIHHFSLVTTTLVQIYNLKITMVNINSSGSTTDTSIYANVMGVARLGSIYNKSYPTVISMAATTHIKAGAGTLCSIIIGTPASGSSLLNVYDNTIVTGTPIISIDATNNPTPLLDINYDFSLGLTIETTGTPGSYTIFSN